VYAPASLLALPLLAGCAAGLLSAGPDHLPFCAAAGAVLALLAGAAACADGRTGSCISCLVVGGLSAGLSLGASAASEAYSPPLLRWFHASTAADGTVLIEGRIAEDAFPGAFGVPLRLDVSRVAVASGAPAVAPLGGVRLSVAGTLAAGRIDEWRAGRLVRVTAALREPARYLNPGVPDDRRVLARRGVVLVGSIKSAALVEILASGSAPEEAAAACRAWVRRRLADSVGRWSARSGGVATAILLGDRTGMDRDDERRLQEAGTYHVIAISGGNIATLTVLLLAAFRAIRLPPRASAGATIVLLLFYGAIVVPASSVGRAIAAATIYLAGRLIDLTGPAINVLAFTAVVALAASPVAPFDPGFILSFGATLGILVGAPRLIAFVRPASLAWRIAAGTLAATMAAEIALGPWGAVFFSRVTAAGLALNFVAIPLMTLVQAGSLALLALSPLHEPAARWCGYVVHLAATGLVESARVVELAPWLAREVPPPAWELVVLYYSAVICALTLARIRRPAWLAAAVAGLCIVLGPAATARERVPPPPAALRVVFLDVGQGDATLVVLPDGRTLLIDAGGFPIPALQEAESGQRGRYDIGERVVSPALRAFGVRRLDTFVLTHADPDHVGGAAAVLRAFRPRAVWEGVPVPRHRELIALGAMANAIGAEWRSVVAGDLLRVGPVQVRALHPPLPEWERQRVRNEDSVVLEVRYGDVAVVLPGDIGRDGEAAVLAHVRSAPLVVLKAAHHGSASSSTPAFLSALRPSVVVFSVGRANRFGHPAPAVVSRFRQIGAAIFSTAADGAVILDTDGKSVEIRGWTGRSVMLRASRPD
jgi:competence protein ComEC